ncbi:MAG: methionine--tRNA ligase [Gemmatimonadetes bacterium]|nr:methionine--tRNA ligase [Gemmatimonadota bacterium]MYD26349.1 methionine--tRNA ligase [Gemmatimonadota bacterium]
MVVEEKILVTDALPYANGKLHIGHIAGVHLPGNIYVRYQRLKGRDVVHVSGSDDHGVAITLAAEKQGITPKELVDKYYPVIRGALEDFGIVYDNFSQTSRLIHHETARDYFRRLDEKGCFDVREVDQIYCPANNRFLPDRYVEGTCPHCGSDRARGDQCEACGTILDATQLIDPHSDVCKGPLEVRPANHWYFKLARMSARLQAWIDTKTHWKANVRNYCQGWFNEGLSDRPISRDLDWGVELPIEEAVGKVMYVWFENTLGYVSSTREWAVAQGDPDRWKDYWLNPDCKLVNFLGKDNIVFHAILWPAMIMEHGDFVLPSEIPANEFLNIEGQKLSTSRNWAVWLDEYLEDFPPDPMRYCLASISPETKDSDFTWKDFQARNNNELADIFGNFVNRTLTFINRYFDGVIPEPGTFSPEDREMLSSVAGAPDRVGACFESFQVRGAVRELIALGNQCNRYFNDQAPWNTRKTDRARCAATLHVCMQAVRVLAVVMSPILPFSAERLWKMAGLEGRVDAQMWDEIEIDASLSGRPIGDIEILFHKIEDDTIDAQIARLGRSDARNVDGTKSVEAEPAGAERKELVSIDAFREIDLRIADIVAAEPVPGTDRLLRLQLRIGAEERQIVSGIAPGYTPEKLVGRQIVVVANLEPATIRGVESRGMLLAAEDDDGAPILLGPDVRVQSGSSVT